MKPLFFHRLFLYTFIAFNIHQCYCIAQPASAHKVFDLVQHYKSDFIQLPEAKLFNISNERNGSEDSVLKSSTRLILDKAALQQLIHLAPGGVELTIPYKETQILVELVKSEIFTTDFQIYSDASGKANVSYQPGIYYRGCIKDDPSSLVAFSFFDQEVVGMIVAPEGLITVGKLLNSDWQTGEYIVYNNADLVTTQNYSCATYDDPAYAARLTSFLANASTVRTNNCVRLYYESDYAIYQANGINMTNTLNWITAIHNNVSAIYANDDIMTAISEIFVWTQPDPFTANSSITQLNLFKTYRASFNGDIGQLMSLETGNLGGIASAINGLCSSTDKYAYSDVEFSYGIVPAYSWTVNVVAHEFGHLLGSYHTHNCNWPQGAIDNCGPLAGYPNEGGTCPIGPPPLNGGTIMSYCHLTSFGINFNNGFGPYPSEAIRSAVDASGCLSPSCIANPPAYCLSTGQSTAGEWIQSVKLENLDLVSGQGSGYSDFTNHVVNLQPGSSVTITLTPGYSGTNYDEVFCVWIDYNKDLDFNDLNEKVFESDPVFAATSGTFTIPSGLAGNTRMRISMKFDTSSSTCESFKYGEVEDYSVSFVPLITYCPSAGENSDKEWIDYVKCASIERISGNDDGYFDGTEIASSLTLNSVNTIIFSAGFSGFQFKESWKGWIDFNGDGIFENEERILSKNTSKKGLISKIFMVPPDATIGKTRMRISMKRGGPQTACDTFSKGEVEDYSILILPETVAISNSLSAKPSKLICYPVPAHDVVTFQLDVPATSVNVELLNLTGQVVQKQSFPNQTKNFQLKVAPLPPGIYFVRVRIPGSDPITLKWLKA